MLGISIQVLAPGEANAMYHWETEQEDFLVLYGEGIAIVEGHERALRQWDFVHCPPETRHVFVGAGDGPCVILAASSRQFQKDGPWGYYSVDETAGRYNASPDVETQDTRSPTPTSRSRSRRVTRACCPRRHDGLRRPDPPEPRPERDARVLRPARLRESRCPAGAVGLPDHRARRNRAALLPRRARRPAHDERELLRPRAGRGRLARRVGADRRQHRRRDGQPTAGTRRHRLRDARVRARRPERQSAPRRLARLLSLAGLGPPTGPLAVGAADHYHSAAVRGVASSPSGPYPLN